MAPLNLFNSTNKASQSVSQSRASHNSSDIAYNTNQNILSKSSQKNKIKSLCPVEDSNIVIVMPQITGECSLVVEAVCSVVFITLVIESV